MGKTAAELRYEIEMQREEVGRDLDALGDRVSPGRIVERRTAAVRSGFRSAKEKVMGSNDPSDAARSIGDRVGDTKDQAADLARSAADEVTGVPDRIRSGTEGNPLAAGLIAFGAGLLAATLIPTTRQEEELVQQIQPQLEKAGSRAAEAGRELVDNLRPEVEQAVTAVRDDAVDAGQRLAADTKDAATQTVQAAHSTTGVPGR